MVSTSSTESWSETANEADAGAKDEADADEDASVASVCSCAASATPPTALPSSLACGVDGSNCLERVVEVAGLRFGWGERVKKKRVRANLDGIDDGQRAGKKTLLLLLKRCTHIGGFGAVEHLERRF